MMTIHSQIELIELIQNVGPETTEISESVGLYTAKGSSA